MKRLSIIYTIILFLLTSCGYGSQTPSSDGVVDTMHFAKELSITHMKEHIKVEVRNPWDTTRIMKRYLLVDRNLDTLPKNMEAGEIVKIPVKRAAVYSSVHASIIEMLNRDSAIVAACEVQYMDSKNIRNRVKDGSIADLGESTSPNIEKIIYSGAEIIISSPFKDTGYGAAEKLGIPIIEGADYMESHPLGRVEWIKFYGLLFGAKQTADDIYNSTSEEYLELKKIAESTEKRPTIFADTKYGATWFISGANSYSAHLYKDAGADYIFSSISGSGSVQMPFENVLDKAIHADYWLIKYYRTDDMNYQSLYNEYEPYGSFDAFKKRSIYGCNTSHIKYYEQTPMRPQLLLRDLIYIFHPELLPDHKPRFFTPLSE